MGQQQSHTDKGAGPGGCALAGAWVPIRKGEWKARVLGTPHHMRAKMPNTKMVYDRSGNGKGWVGDVHVKVKVHTLARNQFSSTAKTMFWSGGDGNLTLHNDGTLEVRYPSSGIIEYWKRSGHAPTVSTTAKTASPTRHTTQRSSPSRKIKIVFRKMNAMGIGWHWALALGDSIYEVGGLPMGIVGPRGVVCGVPTPGQPGARSGTKLNQFHGYVPMQDTSHRTDAEIDQFSKDWVKRHPIYNPLGPNCQTFTEDLYTYLTGKNLAFSKFADLKSGPERSANVVWIDATKKP